LSSAGMCRSFDAEADGFVRSEGCVVVILKRLADALRDKNPILGTVCGSAVSHDGARGGLTAPDVGAQQEIMGKALDSASVQAKQVAYIEAHGLASLMTDATELQAIDGVLGKGRPAGDPVLVSSVKPNIGHVETASGLTSLLKATLVMQNQQVPPLLHFSKLNPNAPKSNFYKICRTATPWPQGRTAYACVNSFGRGGTNAHVVLRGPNA